MNKYPEGGEGTFLNLSPTTREGTFLNLSDWTDFSQSF
jgi:hypothetical protein